jgi:hypothetical protein
MARGGAERAGDPAVGAIGGSVAFGVGPVSSVDWWMKLDGDLRTFVVNRPTRSARPARKRSWSMRIGWPTVRPTSQSIEVFSVMIRPTPRARARWY